MAGWLAETGTGPPVLLIHGWTGFKEVFDGLATALVDAGHRVLVPDLPGWGDRPEGPVKARESAAYAASLEDLLSEREPMAVLGHSMGGQVAIRLAVAHPDLVTRLVLISTPVVPAPERWTLPRTFVQSVGLPVVGKHVTRAAIAALKRRPSRLRESYRGAVADPDRIVHDPVVQSLADRAMESFRQIPAERIADSLWRIARTDLRPLLGSIRQPTLVIGGNQDWTVNPANSRTIAAAVPGARLVMIDDVGHIPYLERPEIVVDEVIRFLAGDAP